MAVSPNDVEYKFKFAWEKKHSLRQRAVDSHFLFLEMRCVTSGYQITVMTNKWHKPRLFPCGFNKVILSSPSTDKGYEQEGRKQSYIRGGKIAKKNHWFAWRANKWNPYRGNTFHFRSSSNCLLLVSASRALSWHGAPHGPFTSTHKTLWI